ncbi:MAG: ComEC/Rec2 family competence protein, partial [Candidatus Omnitrophota bacterium]|jgi:competence protein ComEC
MIPVFASLILVFCAGIFFADKIHLRFPVFYWTGWFMFALTFLSLKVKLLFKIFSCILIFLTGAAVLKNTFVPSGDNISRFIHFKSAQEYLVKGVVASNPEQEADKITFIFQVKEIQSEAAKYKCSGNILVRCRGRANNIEYAQDLVLRGRIIRPYSGYRRYLSRKGIYLIMNIGSEFDILRLGQGSRFSLTRLSYRLKENIGAIFTRYLSPLPAAIACAMVLGDKSDIPPLINSIMMRTGTIHILVVSGFNVGIIAFITGLTLKIMRIPKKTRLYAIIPCLVTYCLMTGGSNPVLRATIMAVMIICAMFIQREANIYNALAAAAFFILIFKPGQFFDIGFELSFASVWSIACIYPKLNDSLGLAKLKFKPFKFLAEGFLVSLAAWLGTAGIIAHYFKIISPITVFANILIVPLATLITLLGLILVFFGMIFPPLAACIAPLNQAVTALLVFVAAFFASIPFAYLQLP